MKFSERLDELSILAEVNSPALRALADHFEVGKTDDTTRVVEFVRRYQPDLVFIGPEEPLFAGVVNVLEDMGIPCVGPRKEVAQIEWSKAFARELLAEHVPSVNPRFRVFTSTEGVEDFLDELREFVIKPDGLTGGKGVRVSGDHLGTLREGAAYCAEVLSSGHPRVVIEEKLDGEEFTLQSFCDGTHVVHTIPVQDHKRLLDGDRGPNTGGMGSYSCADHMLPFLSKKDLLDARHVNEVVARELRVKTGIPYKGILYGGFIATREGIKVIEYNSRFGDPEVMNIIPLLETDFLTICEAITDGTLTDAHVRFAPKATVCKYLVPRDYPYAMTGNGVIDAVDLMPETSNLKVYYAAIEGGEGSTLKLTSSRAVALVGIADTLDEAARICETAAAKVRGPIHHRKDIGSASLVQARVDHMRGLRRPKSKHRAA